MKVELISVMQMLFILMFLLGVITYSVTAARNSIKKLNCNLIKRIFNKSLDYSRFMITKNYTSYEKYDIWRYYVHF